MENPSNNKIRFIPIKTSNAAEDPVSPKEEEKHDMSEDDPEFLPEMSNSQKKRQSYPIDVKLEVIEYAKKTSRHAAARHFGISRKCISQWVAVEERLREFKNVTAKGAKLRLPGAGRRVQKTETDEGYKGFAYTKHRLSVDGRRTYWRCERRSSLTGCHGRAVTIGNEEGQPVLLTVHHNHPPSEKYGPLTGGTGVHGWAIGGDVVGTSSTNTTPPPTNVRGVPIVPKISRCDIAKTYGETAANSSRKRRFETPQFPFALSLPPFIGDGEPPNLTKAEDTPNSPQNCSSYSTLEQFINSHSDNNLPPFLESAQDNFNVEIAMKRPHLEDNNDGAELGELYSTEGFFDPNNESCKDNERAAKLDLLKKEWEEFPSYDPSQPSSSSLAAVQQSADALINNSSANQINNVSSSSFGGTALIREKSQLDFFLQLPINTEFTGTSTNDMKQMPTTQEWENDPRTIELRKQLNDALDRERNSQHKLQKTVDELLDARSEIDVKNAKNERLEKRLKNANDELASLREQLDQSMDHRETLERQQFELNLKESRKRTELQRELEAKEDEMEEMRIQFQRKIRNLESTLDDAQLEISSLLKQKKAAWQRNSQSVSMNGSLLDLAQNNSPENRTLKGKLARAMALIQSSKIHFDKDSFEENSRNLKNNLGSSVFSSVCGGSEFGDLEDVLLEEEGKEVENEGNVSTSQPKLEDGGGGECASRETITSLLAAIEKEQHFDGLILIQLKALLVEQKKLITVRTMTSKNEGIEIQNESEISRVKKCYRSHDVSTKLEAIDWAKKNSIHSASRKFDVDRKIIRNWMNSEKELEQLEQQNNLTGGQNRKRLAGGGRKVSYPGIEKELSDWLNEMTERNIPASSNTKLIDKTGI
uniref:Uncharacterized protein n=1 Tax=Meloidogyne enterolobii TaxID=390850 RepID=A0A6V7W151_MELEN|nr:unnamed protein product [Meloidogyne enterolobii]